MCNHIRSMKCVHQENKFLKKSEIRNQLRDVIVSLISIRMIRRKQRDF